LLLRGDSATAKGSLHELFKIIRFLGFDFFMLGLSEIIGRETFSSWLRLLLYLKELTSVLIAIVYSDLLPKYQDILSDAEIER
jgi:hypothetical protein